MKTMHANVRLTASQLVQAFAVIEQPNRQGRSLDFAAGGECIAALDEQAGNVRKVCHGCSMLGCAPICQLGMPQLPSGSCIWDKTPMNTASETLAGRVQERMDALGLNPFATAKRAGLKPGYVHDLLRGKVINPGADKLRALAIALEASSAYLLDGAADAPVLVVDHDGNVVQPEMKRATTAARAEAPPEVIYLPIRHELAAHVWRSARDVTDRPLGYDVAIRPQGLARRDTWFEYVRDSSMQTIIPSGSIVHVAELLEGDEAALQEGDIVVIVKRLFVGEPEMHLVERSLRRIRHYMPEHGLWMYELATGDPEEDWTDEVFRQDDIEMRAPPKAAARRAVPPPAGALDPKIKEALDRMDSPEFAEQMKAMLASMADRRPRIAGRVLSARIPISRDTVFV